MLEAKFFIIFSRGKLTTGCDPVTGFLMWHHFASRSLRPRSTKRRYGEMLPSGSESNTDSPISLPKHYGMKIDSQKKMMGAFVPVRKNSATVTRVTIATGHAWYIAASASLPLRDQGSHNGCSGSPISTD